MVLLANGPEPSHEPNVKVVDILKIDMLLLMKHWLMLSILPTMECILMVFLATSTIDQT